MLKYALSGAALALVLAAPASAASYNFNVIYSGNDIAALAGGSDDPLTTNLVAGDSFTYRLTAAGAGQWTTLAAGSIFPFFALYVSPGGTRTVDYVLNLNNNGGSVFNDAQNGVSNSFVHLGTNTVAFGSGLVWDQYELAATILAGSDPATAQSLLPFPGQGPETFSPTFIRFDGAAVPEPATWALMIGGFGMLGAAARRRARPSVTYA